MTQLSLSLLGAFQAWTGNGEQQSFRTLKERALLAYLAVEHGHAHRREALASLLWPDRAEGVARNNLRQALYGLRQVIGETAFDNIFTITSSEVIFNLSDQVWLDTAAFDVHLRTFQAHVHHTDGPCPYCLQHVRDAVEIYRDQFLKDIQPDKNPEYQKWVAVRREQFFSSQVQALRSLIEMQEKMGEDAQAAAYALRLVQIDDFNESNYRLVMTLLARVGRHNDALEQYEICQRKLHEGADIEPGEETKALAEQIQQGRFHQSQNPAQLYAHNLPVQLTPFIGREMELANLTRLMENPSCRLISIIGPGGVGKTRLAVQTALMHLHSFPDGVCFVPLDAVNSADHLAESISRTIGLVPAGGQDLQEALFDFIRLKRVLLVLDNLEHLLEGRSLLLELLQAASFARIIVTTRERLMLQAEFLLQLSGLPFPTNDQMMAAEDNGHMLVETNHYPAVQLLFERSSRLRPDIAVHLDEQQVDTNDAEIEAAVKICQLVEGLPLGIELAASWAHNFTFGQIADEIKSSLDFLATTNMLDLPERHHSLRASFEHSWDLLSETEQEIFCKLSVFPGSFAVSAAQDVAGAAFPWLMRLENKSLIRRVAFGRYDLHPLIRQFAGHKLRQFSRKIEDQVRQQHAQFFCVYMKERGIDLRALRQLQALTEMDLELENIRAAWDWVVEHNSIDLLRQAAFGLFYYLETRSRWQEGETSFSKASLQLKKINSGQNTQDLLAFMLAVQGWFACRLTHFEQAHELLTSSLKLFPGGEPGLERCFAHFALGFLSVWMGAFEQAITHLSVSLALAEKVGDVWSSVWAREILTEIAFESGQPGIDEKIFLQLLGLFDQMGEQRGKSRVLNYLGNIAMAEDRYLDAHQYFESMLTSMERLGDVWGAAGSYSKLGQLAVATANYEQAWALFHRAFDLIQKTGDQRRAAYILGALGEVAAALGKKEEAKSFFSQAFVIAARMRNLSLAQDILTCVAAAFRHVNQQERSAELLALVFANQVSDRLTADRASRLIQDISANHPTAQTAEPENLQRIWETVEQFLREDVPL
jgi:predicted ATPase/DNA-binding SARP family transcriptional activator